MFVLAALGVVAAAGAPAAQRPVPRDPVMLNIAVNCQWQQKCIAKQRRAMKQALNFVRQQRPPVWRIQLCNRNAAKSRTRVDWVGFRNCIRNPHLRPAPQRKLRRGAPVA